MQGSVTNGNVTVSGTIEGALDSTGVFFPLASAAKVHTIDAASGLVSRSTASYNGSVWVRDYTITNGAVTAESLWVKQ